MAGHIGIVLEVITRAEFVLLAVRCGCVHLSDLRHLVVLRVQRIEKTIIGATIPRDVPLARLSLPLLVLVDEVVVGEAERGRFEVALLPL